MHGDLSEMASFSACDARELLLTRSLLSDLSQNHGILLLAQGSEWSRERPTGVTPPTSSCNCRLTGPVPLRLSALRLTYCYLRTTTEAMARLYRVIVLMEDRIPRS